MKKNLGFVSHELYTISCFSSGFSTNLLCIQIDYFPFYVSLKFPRNEHVSCLLLDKMFQNYSTQVDVLI